MRLLHQREAYRSLNVAVVLVLRSGVLLRSYAVWNANLQQVLIEKRVIESFPYDSSVYYIMYNQLITYRHAREPATCMTVEMEVGIAREKTDCSEIVKMVMYQGLALTLGRFPVQAHEKGDTLWQGNRAGRKLTGTRTVGGGIFRWHEQQVNLED